MFAMRVRHLQWCGITVYRTCPARQHEQVLVLGVFELHRPNEQCQQRLLASVKNFFMRFIRFL